MASIKSVSQILTILLLVLNCSAVYGLRLKNLFPFHSDRKFEYETLPVIGVVMKINVRGRFSPKPNSESEMYFSFAVPLLFTEKSEHREKIGNKDEYWYREKKSGLWIHGADIIRTENKTDRIFKFIGKRYNVNAGCGGNSCSYAFSSYIVNDIYMAYVPLTDYHIDEKSPGEGFIVGNCRIEKETVLFKNAHRLLEERNGEITELNPAERNYETDYTDWLSEDFIKVFTAESDEIGKYYIDRTEPYMEELRNTRLFYKKEYDLFLKRRKSEYSFKYRHYTLQEAGLKDMQELKKNSVRLKFLWPY